MNNKLFDRLLTLIILLTMLAIALSARAAVRYTVMFKVQQVDKDKSGTIITLQPVMPVKVVAVPLQYQPNKGDFMKCVVSDEVVGYIKDPQHPQENASGSFQVLDCGGGGKMVVKGLQYTPDN